MSQPQLTEAVDFTALNEVWCGFDWNNLSTGSDARPPNDAHFIRTEFVDHERAVCREDYLHALLAESAKNTDNVCDSSRMQPVFRLLDRDKRCIGELSKSFEGKIVEQPLAHLRLRNNSSVGEVNEQTEFRLCCGFDAQIVDAREEATQTFDDGTE